MINSPANRIHIKYQILLCALVSILVFEGIIRKVLPSALGMPIFFLKDALCIISLYFIIRAKFYFSLSWLYNRWIVLVFFFSPLLIYTALLDFTLSIFAAKQYLLYIVVAILVPMAFPQDKAEEFKRFCAFFALLLVPTALVSMLQNSLPSSHWLNLSIGGGSLETFSAADHLRVSSTFSFTGQYSWFLNAVCGFWAVTVFLPPNIKVGSKRLIFILLGILQLISIFITGGRTAVVGSVACLFVGFVLSSWRVPSLTIRRGVVAGLLLFASLIIVRAVKPEFFAAYDERSRGSEQMSHNEEIQERVLGEFTNWTKWFWDQDITSVTIGNGLGVMSNGSDKISTYAKSIRMGGFWTEGDIATSAWEGGIYLLLVWYGFRLAIIIFSFQLWYSIKNKTYTVASSFLLANVIITAATGNIGMQPPIAIWWWLSVGSIMAIQGFDKREFKLNAEKKRKNTVALKATAAC